MERANKFDRMIKWRNVRECLAGVVVAGIFAFNALQSPNGLARAGNIIVAASGVWYLDYIAALRPRGTIAYAGSQRGRLPAGAVA